MDPALAISAGEKAGRCLSIVGGGGATRVRNESRRAWPLLRAGSNWREDRAGTRSIHAASHYFGSLPGIPDPGGRLKITKGSVDERIRRMFANVASAKVLLARRSAIIRNRRQSCRLGGS